MYDTSVSQVVDGLASQEKGGQVNAGALTPREFLGFAYDIQHQPAWRVEADKCVDYYDNNQLDLATLQALQAKGMGPLINNLIAPIINVVLGMEAKTRSDWRVTADDDAVTEVAEALSAKLFEVERESHADRACSDAYGGQIKAGLGWVEVSRERNPFEYPYRVGTVHRREIFWDWRDLSYNLKKSRYLVRKRWYDLDQAKAFFPASASFLEAYRGDSMRTYLETIHQGLELAYSLEQLRMLDMADYEQFRSWDRERICLYEVWYRRWIRGYVLRLPTGDVIELNMKNPLHVALLARGVAKPEAAVYAKMRMGIWAGPIRLMDVDCGTSDFPYVPFWGYREDRTGVPYGLVRLMLSPQDEVNARRQKMMWLMSSKRVIMDADALDQDSNDTQAMLDEIARPDAVVVLNPNRINKQGSFAVDSNQSLSKDQFEVMKDAEQGIQRVVGVFNSMLGDRQSGADSGIAINSLVEQGTTGLAEINDNYRFARRLVGERILDLLRPDMIGQPVQVMVGETGRQRTISLNKPGQHPQNPGQQIVLNDVQSAKVKVALEDVPSTPSYRQQQLQMLTEVMKGMPPQLQAAIAPFYLEATDLRQRREMADAARRAMGQQVPSTPEEEQQMEQEAQQAKAQQQEAIRLELLERAAKIEQLQAQAAKFRADAMAQPGDMDDQEKQELEQEIDRITKESQGQVDQQVAQRLTDRNMAQMREQALRQRAAMDAQSHKQRMADQDAAHSRALEDMKRKHAAEKDQMKSGFADKLSAAREAARAKKKAKAAK